MPIFKNPFAQLASAPPPGSSYYISNVAIIAKRVALGLERPVRIQDVPPGKDDPLFDWYRRHEDAGINSMQLRKEHKAPFFHEYISFRLTNNRCFRIDRRQLPDERSPMSCAEDRGVEAYDTIEEITSLEDSSYNASDCLCQIDFVYATPISKLILILTEICLHRSSRVYTVQKYNCYFYAQTVIFLSVLRSVDLKAHFNVDPIFDSQDKIPVIVLHPNQPGPSQITGDKRNDRNRNLVKQPNERGSDLKELQDYLLKMIQAHSVRVEQYKFLLRFSAKDVEEDIKKTMCEIWKKLAGGLQPIEMWEIPHRDVRSLQTRRQVPLRRNAHSDGRIIHDTVTSL